MPLSGVPWFLFVIGIWLMLVASAIFFADTLEALELGARPPLLLEAVLWLALPMVARARRLGELVAGMATRVDRVPLRDRLDGDLGTPTEGAER